MYIYVEEIHREWWIFENVDDDNVEWSEISGKKNWKNLLFISLSLFSLRGKIDFLLSLKFVCSCFNFKPQNLFSWMLLVNAHHSGRERERYKLPWRYVYLHLNTSQYVKRIITARKRRSLLMEEKRETKIEEIWQDGIVHFRFTMRWWFTCSLVFDTFRK